MPEQAPTLRDMIEKAIADGRTLRELEARAIDEQGNKIGKDTIRKIRHGLVDRMPLESHLRAIAVALRVPYERVRQAAIAQWLPPEQSTATELPEDTRSDLIAQIQELRALADRVEAELASKADQAGPGAA